MGVGDHPAHAPAFDQLHRVIVQPVFLASAIDRHNIAVLQRGGRLRFALETLNLFRHLQGMRRQDLDGNAAVEALLNRFVHHPHAAATHFPQDAVVSNPLRRFETAAGSVLFLSVGQKRGKTGVDVRRPLGEPRMIFGTVRRLPPRIAQFTLERHQLPDQPAAVAAGHAREKVFDFCGHRIRLPRPLELRTQ